MHINQITRPVKILASVFLLMILMPGMAVCQKKPECQQCHGVPNFRITNSKGKVINLSINRDRFNYSIHGGLQCYECHTNMTDQYHSAGNTVIPDNTAPYVKQFRPDIQPAAASCASCHKGAFKSYEKSIHAAAIRGGDDRAPYCTDCHGSHYMLPSQDMESAINPVNVPSTCASCHAVDLLMSRRNINTNTVVTFRQSVHGRKLALGEKDVAVCTSCHGIHDIMAPNNPESKLSSKNIVATCRKCHRGAGASFATSFKHVTPSETVEPLIYWVQQLYRATILFTVAGMTLYVLIDLIRRLYDRYYRRRRQADEH